MFYEIENGRLNAKVIEEIAVNDQRQYLGLIDYDGKRNIFQKLDFNANLLTDSIINKSMTFENFEGYDFICLNFMNHKTFISQADKVFFYVRKNIILIVSKNISSVEKILNELMDGDKLNISFDKLLCAIFEKLTSFDLDFLEKIEQEISDLEGALITTKKRDCVKEIISLRKRLMALKRYYEQLLNVLDELQENDDNIFHGIALRHFKIFEGKVDRRYHNVLNLRDYVTQVREAYQAEVDIDLNNIMKVFTMITVVFLPLTLIVGWFGMNLQMPEYGWPYVYPLVILISIAVVIFCIVYFKKRKWL